MRRRPPRSTRTDTLFSSPALFRSADEALQAGLVHRGLFAALLLLALAAFPVLFHQLVFLQLAEAGVDLFLGGGDAIDHLLARDDQVGMAFAVGLAVVGEAGARLVVPGRDLAFALQLLVELFHLAFDVAAQEIGRAHV